MENKRITLETVTTFQLSMNELRKLYLSLALLNYKHLCYPDYDEKKLLTIFSFDMRMCLTEITLCCDKSPNNLRLSSTLAFINLHHKNLTEIIKQDTEEIIRIAKLKKEGKSE